MAVPTRKNPRARRNSRRANHDKVSAPALSSCSNCAELMIGHRVCPACGYYKGRQIIDVDAE